MKKEIENKKGHEWWMNQATENIFVRNVLKLRS